MQMSIAEIGKTMKANSLAVVSFLVALGKNDKLIPFITHVNVVVVLVVG